MQNHVYSAGPWYIDSDDPCIIRDAEGTQIAWVLRPKDARIVISTPNLYLACRKALDKVIEHPECSGLVNELQDAVDLVENRLLNIKEIKY